VVIAAIDSSQVASAAEQAKEAGATIIGYDRNILNTEAIDYYVTFDNYKVGELQAQYVIDQLDLANNSGPFNVELISGDSADSNFHFFVGGALDTLKPYLDEGVLAIPSGRNTEAKIATGYWGNESGQKRMEDLIVSEKYGPNGTPLAAVVSTDDPLAQGISSALRDDGYTPEDFPLLTGMNADIASVKNIIAGYQSMTIFKDTREAAQKTADGIVAFAKGETPEINETKEYNNGVKDVDTYLCTPVVVTKDNYQEMLVDSGYYTEDDLS
jgi:putative multiple sugar transport system substrate-binding protein